MVSNTPRPGVPQIGRMWGTGSASTRSSDPHTRRSSAGPGACGSMQPDLCAGIMMARTHRPCPTVHAEGRFLAAACDSRPWLENCSAVRAWRVDLRFGATDPPPAARRSPPRCRPMTREHECLRRGLLVPEPFRTRCSGQCPQAKSPVRESGGAAQKTPPKWHKGRRHRRC